MEIRGNLDDLRLGPVVEEWKPWVCVKCGNHVFQVVFCKGNLPPTATLRSPDGQQIGELDVLCAGLSSEHLHLHCRTCGHHRLMETKDMAEKRVRVQIKAART